MIGLHRAHAAGVGCDIDVSLLDTAISMLNYLAVWTLNSDWRPRRLPEGAHQSLVPSQSFQTRDGWIVIMCMKEKFWERLVERMRSEEHTSELQSHHDLVCRLLLEKKKKKKIHVTCDSAYRSRPVRRRSVLT